MAFLEIDACLRRTFKASATHLNNSLLIVKMPKHLLTIWSTNSNTYFVIYSRYVSLFECTIETPGTKNMPILHVRR